MINKDYKKIKIGVLGLGYVGLPLADCLSKKFKVVGFDTDRKRIFQLRKNFDHTKEIKNKFKNIYFAHDYKSLNKCNFFIITVPTPIDKNKKPDLLNLMQATDIVCKVIKKDSIVVLESTVYPGVTEEIIAKRIEKKTNYKLNKNFFVGYSPERINPGDKVHTIDKITKVISASSSKSLDIVDFVYSSAIKAGTYRAKTIKIAEAAKIIENTQRDLNIGLINELTLFFSKLNINVFDVLEAASTKWNFINMKPGLVGGHCIGVDPYYLSYKFKKIGVKPTLINAARKINDNMAEFFAKQILIEKKKHKLKGKMLILGFTFKENIPDYRNTKIENLYINLRNKHKNIFIYDPFYKSFDKKILKNYNFIKKPSKKDYDIVVLAVKHNEFLIKNNLFIKNILKQKGIIFDIHNLVKGKSDNFIKKIS
jgi:UDP-N-acetyl-D-glucosamine/UDP-N-acetyl-D-galactosamine dehydrogenase